MKEFYEPIFNKTTGYLNPGVYLMTIEQLLNHKVFGGTKQRKKLILSLKEA